MSKLQTHIHCPGCDELLELHLGECAPSDLLDVLLVCPEECGQLVLNAFVSLDTFIPVEGSV